MENLIKDIGHALRSLRRSPVFTTVVLLTLLLGIGATSAIFSVVDTVLLRPLPYPDSDRIVRLWSYFTQRDLPPLSVSDGEFFDYREQSRVFEHLGVFVSLNANLTGFGEPERVFATYTSAGFFPTLGVAPALGRVYGEEEDGPQGPPVVLISHGLWQRRFGSEPNVVGRSLELNGHKATVLGVMPQGFEFPEETEVWSPLGLDPANQAPRGQHYLHLIARLKPGVSLEQAQQEIGGIAARFGERYPVEYPAQSGWTVHLVPLQQDLVGETRPALSVLSVAVALVLLIACVNVANLLLARAQTREREVAIRAALGATRTRLIQFSLLETVLLALASGALGLLLARWGLDALLAVDPEAVPRVEEIGLDARVVAFTLALALLTGLLLGLVPVLRALRPDLQDALKQGGKTTAGTGAHRFRRALVGAEVALALVLLIGAVLTIRSFSRLTQVDPGFRTERLLTLGLSLSRSAYGEGQQVAQLYDRLLDRIEKLPGVQAASSVSYLPFSGAENRSATFGAEGQPFRRGDTLPEPDVRAIDHRYFRTMGIPLLRGRAFTAADDAQASFPMAVIDEVLAHRLWPGQDPVGRRMKMGPPIADNPNPWITVVGMVKDIKQMSLDAESRGVVYFPQLRRIERAQYLVVRTGSDDPLSLAGAVRAAIQEIDPNQPVSDIRTMEQRLSSSLARPRFAMLLMSVFAAVAAVLAAVGIYGVVAYTVTERTHELGVRMALGAQRGEVLRMILRQGMLVVLAGILAGLIAAFWATRGMAGLLFGVTATDPATYLGVPLFLAAVALVANLVPARRAVRIDPVTALRSE